METEAEALADGDDNQTPRSLIFRQIKRQGKAGSGTPPHPSPPFIPSSLPPFRLYWFSSLPSICSSLPLPSLILIAFLSPDYRLFFIYHSFLFNLLLFFHQSLLLLFNTWRSCFLVAFPSFTLPSIIICLYLLLLIYHT